LTITVILRCKRLATKLGLVHPSSNGDAIASRAQRATAANAAFRRIRPMSVAYEKRGTVVFRRQQMLRGPCAKLCCLIVRHSAQEQP
jgi:hypothetical protein